MGYLTCKAESAIAVSNPQKTHQSPEEKPIKILQFQYSELESATNNFSAAKLLGRGSHGLVYKAVLRGGRPVAVKKPSSSSTEADNEMEILSSLHSPRLVNLLGFTSNPIGRLLVVEFMSNGTLYDALHSNPRPPNWGRRIRLSLQTAKAVETLHSSTPQIIHRDIKSANVLIDRSFNARLGDFGLAIRCHVDDYRLKSTPPAEIISGRKAIDVGHSPPSIVDWAIPLIRRGKLLGVYDPRIELPRDPLVRKQLAVIAAKCVRSCRERRPSMKEVVESLSALSKLVPLHSWNGFSNPCLMVEAVGRPVESRNTHVSTRANGVEGVLGGGDMKFAKPLRNSCRVYSDLGVRNNLMDLLAGTEWESEFRGEADGVEPKLISSNGGSRSRFGSGRFVGRGSGNDNESVFWSRPNRSVKGDSTGCSREDNRIA
ncbi:serine/threonine-protein kinase-like protein At3g51990 isoform X2 [Actinidia eriantha]|uniref:serine/threonine-protein kinase-like protein At3g51990 isoform X2 n=1 Tax=Actinidia eriantha TaxID=165200 RepID=UPI002587BD2D|nr:serine/threonine-protein kinase-like protein At3g51990 isoform X2 [Actinidia eriantha]